VLQVEEEVKPLWSKSGELKRRWRDATQIDLAAPEMRPLIDMRFKPHLWARASLGSEAGSLLREQHGVHAEIGAGAPGPTGGMHRTEH
jgi:hypothetical protein